MKEIELGEVQAHFAGIIWANEPIPSGELVKICNEQLNWKKSTTYTVLKKLCEKGLFQNINGIVSSLISEEDFYFEKSDRVIRESFHDSLPAFIAAFASKKKLADEEIDEIQKIIDSYRKD